MLSAKFNDSPNIFPSGPDSDGVGKNICKSLCIAKYLSGSTKCDRYPKSKNNLVKTLLKKLTPLKYLWSNQDVQAVIVLLCTNAGLSWFANTAIIFYFTVSFI